MNRQTGVFQKARFWAGLKLGTCFQNIEKRPTVSTDLVSHGLLSHQNHVDISVKVVVQETISHENCMKYMYSS